MSLTKKFQTIFILMVLACSNLLAQTDMELGYQYYEDGEYEKAIEYLEPLTKSNYSNELYKVVFNTYLSLKDYKSAEKLSKRFIKNSRLNKMELYSNLLYTYTLAEDEKGAEKLIDDLKKKVSSNPSFAYSLGDALQKKGYPKIALEIYDLATSVNPAMNLDYQKAQLFGELGEIKKMYTIYVNMVERTPSYLPSVKRLLSQGLSGFEESDTEFLKELIIKKIQAGAPKTMNELLIHVYIQEKNFRGAFAQLKALDRRTGNGKSEIFNLGRISLAEEEFDLAIKVFEYVVKAGDDEPFYEEASMLKLQAKTDKLYAQNKVEPKSWNDLQEEYLKVKSELKGSSIIGHLTISLSHFTAFQLNDADSAISMLKNLINTGYISPGDQAKARIELGDILLYTGDRWEAIIYYGQAEKAFEKSPIGQEAKFKRAKAAYFVGDFEWAQGIFDALKASTSKLIANDAMKYSLLINDNIALDTNMDAMGLFARADLLHYQQNEDSALYVLNLLQENFPKHSLDDEVLLLQSKIWIKKSEFEKAAECFQSVIDNYKEDILADDALYGLAELYSENLNRKGDAQELYQRLFTEHPDSFFAADARKKFRELRGDFLN